MVGTRASLPQRVVHQAVLGVVVLGERLPQPPQVPHAPVTGSRPGEEDEGDRETGAEGPADEGLTDGTDADRDDVLTGGLLATR